LVDYDTQSDHRTKAEPCSQGVLCECVDRARLFHKVKWQPPRNYTNGVFARESLQIDEVKRCLWLNESLKDPTDAVE
jgi:hypothetical protein